MFDEGGKEDARRLRGVLCLIQTKLKLYFNLTLTT
jgi:hypothetical protein